MATIDDLIKKFQSAIGVTADGKFGPVTSAKATEYEIKEIVVDHVKKATQPQGETPWLTIAHGELGEKELPGTKNNNSEILKYGIAVSYNGYKATDNDEVPWCAMFVSWCLQMAGFKDTNSALAASYDHYGNSCDLKKGCIVTIRHATGGRHVTFCEDPLPGDTHFMSTGGNESNSVRHTRWPKAHIVATRWPV